MAKRRVFMLAALLFTMRLSVAESHSPGPPETVAVHNGSVTLHGRSGARRAEGRFPPPCSTTAVAACEKSWLGSAHTSGRLKILGPVFAGYGNVFLFLFRRGVELSADQNASAIELMNSELAAHGQESRNALQLHLLENRELGDALAGLPFVRALPDIDPSRLRWSAIRSEDR